MDGEFMDLDIKIYIKLWFPTMSIISIRYSRESKHVFDYTNNSLHMNVNALLPLKEEKKKQP